jgi:amino acid transporter
LARTAAIDTTVREAAQAQHSLKRELRLGDLVLMQVLLILGFTWVGSAAEQGATHAFLWVAGILFLYLPLAGVVMHLSRVIPVEGGSYQWIKAGLSPLAGYLAAANICLYIIAIYGTIGPTMVNSIAYALGPRGAWMMNSNALLVGVGVACLVSVWAINVRGLHLGKIVMNGGAALAVVLGALTMFLLVKRMVSGVPPLNKPFSLAAPAFSIATLNVFTKIAMGGLTGFDNASVFAGECRGARRDLPRSVLVAAPLIALIYVLSTGAMLAWIPAGKMDLAAPIPQLLRAGFGSTGIGAAISVATIAVMTVNSYAGAVAMVGLASRFPMVIAWDRLLPQWWCRLHSKYRTPVKSIGVVSAACIAVQFVSSGGAGGQEMIQIGMGAGIAGLCMMYMMLFGTVLFARKGSPLRPGPFLRLAALSGFVVSLASLPFQVVPQAGVADRWIFALKVGGLFCALNGGAALLYWHGKRSLARTAERRAQPTSAGL